MQHDSVAQFEPEVDPLGRIGRDTMRQDAGVHKARSDRRRRCASIARGMSQLRPPARVARMGDAFPLAEGSGRESAGGLPFKNPPPFLRAAPLAHAAWMRCLGLLGIVWVNVHDNQMDIAETAHRDG